MGGYNGRWDSGVYGGRVGIGEERNTVLKVCGFSVIWYGV